MATAAAFAPQAHAQIIPNPPTQTCGSTTPGGSPPILCTTSTAATGQTCSFARGATGCTANDFVSNPTVISNNISACHIGDTITGVNLTFTLASGSATRYAPGLFIGEQDQPLNAAGGTCSVATFPTTNTETPARVPFPWFAANVGDACGSYQSSFTSVEEVDGVTLKCQPDPNTGNLALTFSVVYAQNSNGAATCTGPANVAPGTSSKCSFGGVSVQNVPVTFNADPACTQDNVVFDPAAQTVTATFVVANLDPGNQITPDAADGTTFEDVVPPPVVVRSVQSGGVTCTPSGGATCDTSATTGNDVKVTITSFPPGSSVQIVVVGDVSSPPAGQYSEGGTVTPGPNVTGDVTGNNTCTNFTQLPVKLQSFDVK